MKPVWTDIVALHGMRYSVTYRTSSKSSTRFLWLLGCCFCLSSWSLQALLTLQQHRLTVKPCAPVNLMCAGGGEGGGDHQKEQRGGDPRPDTVKGWVVNVMWTGPHSNTIFISSEDITSLTPCWKTINWKCRHLTPPSEKIWAWRWCHLCHVVFRIKASSDCKSFAAHNASTCKSQLILPSFHRPLYHSLSLLSLFLSVSSIFLSLLIIFHVMRFHTSSFVLPSAESLIIWPAYLE